jgi:2'-5' RNA ligase
MLGVVVLIEGEAEQRLREALAALPGAFGAGPTYSVPHVSLAVFEECEREHVETSLRSVARSQGPFSVYVAGFGVFPGRRPVLHLAVSRSPRLTVLHRVVLQEVGRFTSGLDLNFTTDRWVPHITLSRADLSADQVGEAARRLTEHGAAFPVPVATLALMEDIPDGQRVLSRFPLDG